MDGCMKYQLSKQIDKSLLPCMYIYIYIHHMMFVQHRNRKFNLFCLPLTDVEDWMDFKQPSFVFMR